MPSPVPNGSPTSHVDRIGRREPPPRYRGRGRNAVLGSEFDPAGLNRGERQRSYADTGQQPDQNGKYPFPDRGNSLQIDQQDVEIDEDFDDDDGGIEHAVGVKNQRERHGERGKAVTDGPVHEGREQRDPGKNQRGGVQGRHRGFPDWRRPVTWRTGAPTW